MADYDRRPVPPRRMPSRRSSELEEEEYSYYEDDEDYYDDQDDYDDDRRRRSSLGDQYNNSSSALRNNYQNSKGGGGERDLVAHDDDYNGGGGRNSRRNSNNKHRSRSNSRNTHHRSSGGGGGGQHTSILPGTPKQAQDIIRRYTLGMPLQNATHMALPPTTPPEGPARDIATLQVANLNPQEYAFVRRSNGHWTFAQVAVRHDSLGQLVFIVNRGGSTKSFKRHEWSGFVRRIKWTERRVQLPPRQPEQTFLEEDNIQDGSSPQLALENGQTKPYPVATPDKPQLSEVSKMSIKEMKIELQSHGVDFSCFTEKQEFRIAVIDVRAEAVKNALIKEQQLQRQQQQEQQQNPQNQQQQDDFGYDNPPTNNNEINLNSAPLDADMSNLAGQTITLEPMQDDEVSELMGDYLLTEYKFQMKVLESERIKKQSGTNKMASVNEHHQQQHGTNNGNGGDGQQSSAYQSFNIESGEGEKSQTHNEKQAFAKSQKWGTNNEDV